jgi:sulfur-carrier protein
MQIKTLFFASYRELAGTDELTIVLPAGERATVADLVAALRTRGAAWAALPDRPVVAVNQEYARGDAALRDGDEVAFIPPVSGG